MVTIASPHVVSHARALVAGVSHYAAAVADNWASAPFRIFEDFQSTNFEI
jgi:hypothetical protein